LARISWALKESDLPMCSPKTGDIIKNALLLQYAALFYGYFTNDRRRLKALVVKNICCL
jgi:hypothetical protein